MDQYNGESSRIETGRYDATLFYTTVVPHDVDRLKAVLRFMITRGPRKDAIIDRPLWDAPPEHGWYYATQLTKLAEINRIAFDPRTPITQLARSPFLKRIEGDRYVIDVGTRLSRGVLYPSIENIEGRDVVTDSEPLDTLNESTAHDQDNGSYAQKRHSKCGYLIDLKMYNLRREMHRHIYERRNNRAAVEGAAVDLKGQIDEWIKTVLV